MKRYENMPDTRPVDVWGRRIGNAYKDKDWRELTDEEKMADFEWKSDILASYGEQVDGDTFYQDYLFSDLYNERLGGSYKVLVNEYYETVDEKGNKKTKSKVHKINVEDISDYLEKEAVALSPCLYHSNWRREDLLNYVSAFVMDIDELRPEQLQRFFRLFEEHRLLKPTFIANSGTGTHFYYLLDKMLQVDTLHTSNKMIAKEIYKRLYDDVIEKEKYKPAQRHWIGQDYRVVGSKTKHNQRVQIFKVGETYTIGELIKFYDVKIDTKKNHATAKMISYAGNIAKDLQIELPDFTDAKETYRFIEENKDRAYQVREEKRQKKKQQAQKEKKRKPGTWYKNTLSYIKDHTQAGNRFNTMKALAMIAFKENIPREVFMKDFTELVAYWTVLDWKGNKFNPGNAEAIIRFYDNAALYGNTSSETLEEWLGYEFKRIGCRRNGKSRKEHLEEARAIRDIRMKRQNKDWRDENGRPSAEQKVKAYREAHPGASKADCIRETGLSKPTVYKWWDGVLEQQVPAPIPVIQEQVPEQEPALDPRLIEMLLKMTDEQRKAFMEFAERTQGTPPEFRRREMSKEEVEEYERLVANSEQMKLDL